MPRICIVPNPDKPEPKRFTAKTAKRAKIFKKGFLCVLRELGGSKILAQKTRISLVRP
jgi:hypothetical protein